MTLLSRSTSSLRMTVALAALLACATVDEVIVVKPDVAFSIAVGKTASLTGNATRLTFRGVREDSRCPTNVVCVWEGDAKIELVVRREGGSSETRVLSLKSPQNEARIGDVVVRFVGLAPYPATPGPISAPRYIAELVVTKL